MDSHRELVALIWEQAGLRRSLAVIEIELAQLKLKILESEENELEKPA